MWTNDDWLILTAIFGFISFVALMQLFPICIRLGKIRDDLRYLAAERERARLLAGDHAKWYAEDNEFI